MQKSPSRALFAVLLTGAALTCGASLGCGRIGIDLLTIADGDGMVEPHVDSGLDEAGVDAATDGSADEDSMCSTACNNDHGSADCTSGSCELSCATGYSDCDLDPSNGCETDTASTVDSCGACGTQCSNDHGSTSCSEGLCVASCDSDYGDCDGNADNGCEAALTNTTSCGACDTACANDHGSTLCVSQACQPSCDSGFADCDGNPDNGCETPLDTVSNCGMCGMVCPANGAIPVCNAGQCETVCDLTGTFAVYLRIYADWSRTGAIESGHGWFEWWARLDLAQSGNSAAAQVRLCGATIPSFQPTVISENYLYQYPNSLFDDGGLPVVSSTLTLGSGGPTGGLSLPTVAFPMGLSMADPLNDPWPSSASGIASSDLVDMDGDGNPGITALFANGGGYVYPRTSTQLAGYNRADREYVAARTSFSMQGMLSSCTSSSGMASFRHIQVRVLGCRRSSGNACDSTEVDNLDSSSPSFSLTNGSYTMTKVADGASCATVRSSLP